MRRNSTFGQASAGRAAPVRRPCASLARLSRIITRHAAYQGRPPGRLSRRTPCYTCKASVLLGRCAIGNRLTGWAPPCPFPLALPRSYDHTDSRTRATRQVRTRAYRLAVVNLNVLSHCDPSLHRCNPGCRGATDAGGLTARDERVAYGRRRSGWSLCIRRRRVTAVAAESVA